MSSLGRRLSLAVGWAWLALVALLAVGLVVLRVAGGQIDLVESASMEPAVGLGAAAITLPIDPAEVEIGDVITFRSGDDRLVLHRVTEVLETDQVRRFRTKGDSNRSTDPMLVHQRGVERRLWFSVGGLGPVVGAAQPPLGLVWLAGLPAVLIWFGARRHAPPLGVGVSRLPELRRSGLSSLRTGPESRG